jgi:hypothetical protein
MLETRRQTGVRPRRPSNAVRSAEGRRVPFAKGQGDAHVGGDAPPGVLGTGRHSALRPLGFAEGTKPRRARREIRRPAAGPSYAAADFARLFDK